MKAVCLIPARGGSVRIPRKNIRPFHGKPVIAYSIENARKSGLFDAIYVSTDDDEIDLTARCHGARVVRRPADDGTKGTQEVAADFLKSKEGAEFGLCCVLYPCAPLLLPEDLIFGLQKLHRPATTFVMSVHEDTHDDIGGLYFGWAHYFRAGEPLDSPLTSRVPTPPHRAIDINTEDDWRRAERMYEELYRGD